jgi:WhiB family redox-sensing transcriptional regulator
MMNLEDLLGSLAGTPSLPGAKCKGKSHIWDQYDCPESIEYALGHCAACPALDACEAYFDSLRPSQRPVGVTAGRVNLPRTYERKTAGAA